MAKRIDLLLNALGKVIRWHGALLTLIWETDRSGGIGFSGFPDDVKNRAMDAYERFRQHLSIALEALVKLKEITEESIPKRKAKR